MKHVLSKLAARDLEDIYLYGDIHFGRRQADTYAAKLTSCIETICAHPEIGRIDKRSNPAVRRIECGSHVIFYDVYSDHIVIVRVLHNAADYVQWLER